MNGTSLSHSFSSVVDSDSLLHTAVGVSVVGLILLLAIVLPLPCAIRAFSLVLSLSLSPFRSLLVCVLLRMPLLLPVPLLLLYVSTKMCCNADNLFRFALVYLQIHVHNNTLTFIAWKYMSTCCPFRSSQFHSLIYSFTHSLTHLLRLLPFAVLSYCRWMVSPSFSSFFSLFLLQDIFIILHFIPFDSQEKRPVVFFVRKRWDNVPMYTMKRTQQQ